MKSSGNPPKGCDIPPSASDPTRRHSSSFRWLQVLGYTLPVVVIVGLELLILPHAGEYADGLAGRYEVLVGVVLLSALAIALFAAGMFHLIRRSQRQVLRESKQLAAVNAVTSAIRDEADVEAILAAARTALLSSSCARDVEFEVWNVRHSSAQPEHLIHPAPTSAGPCDQSRECRCSHVRLTTGTEAIGSMRVEWAAERSCEELGGEALEAIGRQLAIAIHTSQVVADLRTHDAQSSALHEILMGISRRDPMTSLLGLGVNKARQMMAADGAELRLRASAAASVHAGNETDVPTVYVSGIRHDDSAPELAHQDAEAVRRSDRRDSEDAHLSVTLRDQGQVLGELTVVRDSGEPFSAADREHLQAVADVCATAVANARVRLDEHHGAVLEERQRIARELHDSLAQVLAITHLKLRTLAAHPAVVKDPLLHEDVEQIADVCHDAYSDVREAILGLHDAGHKGRPFLETLLVFMTKYSRQCGIHTSLETECEDELHLSPHTELQMIRVIQEALANVRKHSGATTVTVRVSQEARTTLVVVEDDGCGFDVRTTTLGDGFGLSTMRERLAMVGGSLTIKSAREQGTCVIAQLPGGWMPPEPVTKVVDERADSADSNRAG